MKRIVAFDQSMNGRFGVGVSEDGKIIHCKSYLMKFRENSEKRAMIRAIAKLYEAEFKPEIIVIERVRLFGKGGVSTAVIVSLSSCVIAVVDSVRAPVYSVDTRAWKSSVLGSAKSDKEDAVKFLKEKGYDVDHDAADAGCMSLYPFVAKSPLLRKEQ